MYVICYSGGMSSAICAIEAVRKYGKDNVILLNHNISSDVEDLDIKRFKREVAEYLGLDITYKNHVDFESMTPIKACLTLPSRPGWKFKNGKVLCTFFLKTEPFQSWLDEHDPDGLNTYIYGFDDSPSERSRATRRANIMGSNGYNTAFPLIQWRSTIKCTSEIGISPPMGYTKFRHANCIGCLKAGWQHWYIVYCDRPDIWLEAKQAEFHIGYAIHKDDRGPVFLEDKEDMFADRKSVV